MAPAMVEVMPWTTCNDQSQPERVLMFSSWNQVHDTSSVWLWVACTKCMVQRNQTRGRHISIYRFAAVESFEFGKMPSFRNIEMS